MVRTSHHTRRSRVSRRRGVSCTRRSRAKTIRGGSRRSKRTEKHTRGGVDYKKVAALGTAAVVAGLGLRALTRRTKRRAPLPEGPVMELFRSLYKAKSDLFDSPKQFIEFLNSVLEAVVQPCKKAENGEAEFVQQLKDAARTKVDSEPPSEDRDELLTELEASENYYALLTAFRTRDTSAVGHLNEDELSNLISEVEDKFTEVTPQIVFTVKYLQAEGRIYQKTDATKVKSLEDLSHRLDDILITLPSCTNASKDYQNLITDALNMCARLHVLLNSGQPFWWHESLERQIMEQIRKDDLKIKSFDLETLYDLDPCAQTRDTVDTLLASFEENLDGVTAYTENDQVTISRYFEYLQNLQHFVKIRGRQRTNGQSPSLKECADALETLRTLNTDEDRADFKTKIEKMWEALSSISYRTCNSGLVKTALQRVTDAETHLATETRKAETRRE